MAAGALTEEVITEVATNLEEVAQATRALDPRALGFFFGGVGVGLATGFYFGRRWNREKIRAEAFAESQEEVALIREHYERKALVLEKPDLEKVIEEQGYSTRAGADLTIRDLRAPVPIIETPSAIVAAVPEEEQTGKNKDEGWDYPRELSNRSPNAPYVIHEDEFRESEHDYLQTAYTYWEGDGVLTDSDNTPIVPAENYIGTDTLKWGHGSGDVNIVFVRNDRLEFEAEITRNPKSWEEEVQGLDGPEGALRHSHQSHPARRRR